MDVNEEGFILLKLLLRNSRSTVNHHYKWFVHKFESCLCIIVVCYQSKKASVISENSFQTYMHETMHRYTTTCIICNGNLLNIFYNTIISESEVYSEIKKKHDGLILSTLYMVWISNIIIKLSVCENDSKWYPRDGSCLSLL